MGRYSVAFVFVLVATLGGGASARGLAEDGTVESFVDRFCIECHDSNRKAGDVSLEGADFSNFAKNVDLWERVVRKVDTRQMPPPNAKRPTEQEYIQLTKLLTGPLDRNSIEHPDLRRTEPFRRMTRTEYQNAIRDLLSLRIDASTLLPADESSRGFDNITVSDLSPTLFDRYITAAQKISRLALGNRERSPGGDTFRVPADLTQEEHVEGLPLGTRGGVLIPYHFPQSGEYEIQVRLARDRNEHVEGLRESHRLEILVDKERRALLSVAPPRSEKEHETCDLGLKARIKVEAGPAQVGVTFLKNPSSLIETKRQPFQAHYNMHRHPRLTPAVFQVSITGPYQPQGHGSTLSRRAVVPREPVNADEEDKIAHEAIAALVRRAYRRPTSEADLVKPLELYREAKREGGFDAGMEQALSAILINPNFLLRIESDPDGISPGAVYRLGDFELASRLSFFIWSSIPDEELLKAAEGGELRDRPALTRQVKRMLADPRAENLVTNFASQWLHLRNLDSITPDLRLFPDFDDNLRQAFRKETELMLADVIKSDGSILRLLKSDYTYLNERLAKHYGIPHVLGDRFRKVKLERDSARGGLLRQGSILTVTSYATRTSPVIRGKWILENLLGTPPPPPPANVPALKDQTVDASLSVRERLAEHWRAPACAGCHRLMDPVGFTLENYDAVGRYRTQEEGISVDASGGLPDGRKVDGVAGLEAGLLSRPDLFATALTEKLMTFAIGRGIEPSDGAAIRKIVRDAEAGGYKFSSLVEGIVLGTPFQMRKSR